MGDLDQPPIDLSDTKTAVLAMVDAGICYREIAERLGTTRGSVAGTVHRERLSKMSPEDVVRAREMRLATRGELPRPVPASKQVVDDTPPSETPPPVMVPAPISVEISSEPVDFVSVGTGRCRWPLWSSDDQLPGKTLCGASCGREIYCLGHSALAYRPTQPRRAA